MQNDENVMRIILPSREKFANIHPMDKENIEMPQWIKDMKGEELRREGYSSREEFFRRLSKGVRTETPDGI